MVDPTPPCLFPVLILSLGLLLGVMNLQRRRGGPDLMEEGGAAAESFDFHLPLRLRES